MGSTGHEIIAAMIIVSGRIHGLVFRGDGPGEELGTQILDAQVRRHEVAASGPA